MTHGQIIQNKFVHVHISVGEVLARFTKHFPTLTYSQTLPHSTPHPGPHVHHGCELLAPDALNECHVNRCNGVIR